MVYSIGALRLLFCLALAISALPPANMGSAPPSQDGESVYIDRSRIDETRRLAEKTQANKAAEFFVQVYDLSGPKGTSATLLAQAKPGLAKWELRREVGSGWGFSGSTEKLAWHAQFNCEPKQLDSTELNTDSGDTSSEAVRLVFKSQKIVELDDRNHDFDHRELSQIPYMFYDKDSSQAPKYVAMTLANAVKVLSGIELEPSQFKRLFRDHTGSERQLVLPAVKVSMHDWQKELVLVPLYLFDSPSQLESLISSDAKEEVNCSNENRNSCSTRIENRRHRPVVANARRQENLLVGR